MLPGIAAQLPAEASPALRSDSELVTKAILADGDALRYGSSELCSDREFVSLAVWSGDVWPVQAESLHHLEHSSESLWESRDFPHAVVQLCGEAMLAYLSKSTRDYSRLVGPPFRWPPTPLDS